MSTDKNPLVGDATVAAIQDSVRTETIMVGGEVFTTRPVHLPPAEPPPAALKINTLDGIVDYLQSGLDGEAQEVAVHVVSENRVEVLGPLGGRHRQREIYIIAEADDVLGAGFNFAHWYDSEAFIISLQSLFLDTDERKSVLRVVGNIKEEDVRQTGDDGVTQTVTARAGIARVAEVDVPNPVTLQPYRTFREVEQPASPFVLRMRKGGGGHFRRARSLRQTADSGSSRQSSASRRTCPNASEK